MNSCSRVVAVVATAGLLLPMTSRAQTFQIVDPPDTTQTQPFGARNGTVVGLYMDLQGQNHGFSFTRTGVYTSFDAPGADPNYGTYGIGLDDRGNIYGYFYDSGTTSHGFVRRANGKFITFDAGGAHALGTTLVAAVNGSGTSVGTFVDLAGNMHGFIRTADGLLSRIDVTHSQMTQPTDVNDAGDIVGFYVDGTGVQHAFIRNADGTVQTIDDLTGCYFEPFTAAYINNLGDIATTCTDSSYGAHGYLRSHTAIVTVFDFPGALYTTVDGVSGNGDVAGAYLVAGGGHGFTRLSNGTFASFDFPDVGVTETFVYGIDAAGNIFGTYRDGYSPLHGYVRYAQP